MITEIPTFSRCNKKDDSKFMRLLILNLTSNPLILVSHFRNGVQGESSSLNGTQWGFVCFMTTTLLYKLPYLFLNFFYLTIRVHIESFDVFLFLHCLHHSNQYKKFEIRDLFMIWLDFWNTKNNVKSGNRYMNTIRQSPATYMLN